MFFRDHLATIFEHSSGKQSAPFLDAVLMLKTFLRQRSFDKYHEGTFTGFHASMLLAHLLQSHQLPREASAYQMFRKVLGTIAESQWDKQALVMSRPADSAFPPAAEPPEAFQKAFDVVFLDRSHHVNLLSDLSRAAYHDLKREAAAGLRLLDAEEADGQAAGEEELFSSLSTSSSPLPKASPPSFCSPSGPSSSMTCSFACRCTRRWCRRTQRSCWTGPGAGTLWARGW
jgi:hypothetical protein